jgi:hypothetical protein
MKEARLVENVRHGDESARRGASLRGRGLGRHKLKAMDFDLKSVLGIGEIEQLIGGHL